MVSEIVLAWAVEDDLQPLTDGLLLDDSMLGGLVVGIPVVLVTWPATRRHRAREPSAGLITWRDGLARRPGRCRPCAAGR